MIRKILLPALAIALLGGCMTTGYDYRGGNGDYYYGQPQVEYRDYGTPYGYGYGPYGNYGYPGGWSGGVTYQYGYGSYGYPSGYRGGYYDPYRYGYPYRRPVVVRPRPGSGYPHDDNPQQGRDDDRRARWRDLDRLRQPEATAPMQMQRPSAAAITSPTPRFEPRDDATSPRREAREEGRERGKRHTAIP